MNNTPNRMQEMREEVLNAMWDNVEEFKKSCFNNRLNSKIHTDISEYFSILQVKMFSKYSSTMLRTILWSLEGKGLVEVSRAKDLNLSGKTQYFRALKRSQF